MEGRCPQLTRRRKATFSFMKTGGKHASQATITPRSENSTRVITRTTFIGLIDTGSVLQERGRERLLRGPDQSSLQHRITSQGDLTRQPTGLGRVATLLC